MPPHMTAYKSAPYKKKFLTRLEGCSFSVRVRGTSLFIAKKITRLKPPLIRNKFPNKKFILINLDSFFFGHGITLVILL